MIRTIAFRPAFRLTIKVSLITILTICAGVITQRSVLAQSQIPQTKTSELNYPLLRLERLPVVGGAELMLIVAQMKDAPDEQADVPLVAILRDTLGDSEPENDRLRYVWDFSYARPAWWQHVASAVPFFYFHLGSQRQASREALPPLLDLAGERNKLWRRWLWTAVSRASLAPQGVLIGASLHAQERNAQDYRQAHLIRALEIVSLFEQASTSQAPGLTAAALSDSAAVAAPFSTEEMQAMQARLLLAGKAIGELVDESRLREAYQKQHRQTQEWRGRNWELLRQRAEAEGLYFEPLALPDGSATHALLWIARTELDAPPNERAPRKFNPRFLSIADPWRDARLRAWKGYSETRWFDADNQIVVPNTPGARAVELIPLALYGLEYPRIPILLVDFRDGSNPKQREASGRTINDVARDLFSLSRFGNPYYFVARSFLDFVTRRRGVDFNQPSRLQALAKLRLLLALDQSMTPGMHTEITRRLQRATLNPLDNDWRAEAQLARQQYTALVAYAQSADGLPARLERDRRAEMMPLVHGRASRFVLHTASLLSFGLYTHREKATPELSAQMELSRRLAFHQRFLREVAASNSRIEVGWDIAEVRRSLSFLAEHAQSADTHVARLTARIFTLTEDEATRQLALHTLSRLPHREAIAELRRLEQNTKLETKWRELCGQYVTAKERPAVSAETGTSALVGKDNHQ